MGYILAGSEYRSVQRCNEIYTDRQHMPLYTKYNAAAKSQERENQTQERPKLDELQHTQAFITVLIWAKIIVWGGVQTRLDQESSSATGSGIVSEVTPAFSSSASNWPASHKKYILQVRGNGAHLQHVGWQQAVTGVQANKDAQQDSVVL